MCDGVITHLELDFLEFEVKWALGSITINKEGEGDGIPVELFQILKVLHSICQQIWKTRQWPQNWKRSVSIPIPKKGSAKEHSNYCTTVLLSHASKVTLKILQARLQQYMNWELSDVFPKCNFSPPEIRWHSRRTWDHFLSWKLQTQLAAEWPSTKKTETCQKRYSTSKAKGKATIRK